MELHCAEIVIGSGTLKMAGNSQISETKHNIMNNNYLNELKHDTTRQLVVTTRGIDLHIKVHNGWKFVNYNGSKIGLSKIPILQEETEEFNYIFNYGFRK